MMWKIALLVFWSYFCATTVKSEIDDKQIEEVFSWPILQYQWESEEQRKQAVEKGSYILENNVPLGMTIWKDKLFLTVPRWRFGEASSLNYINLTEIGKNKSPLLNPYPNWELNTIPEDGKTASEKSIISTFRTKVDKCDRIWILDTGHINVLNYHPIVYLPPGLIIYDLKTDQFIRRYSFRPSEIKETTFLANIVIDSDENDCENSFAYISDPNAFGMLVYSFAENDSWRIEHQFFHFDPLLCDLTVGDLNFQWTDGLFGIALSNKQPDGFRTAYFHPTCGNREFKVSTATLQNKTAATSLYNYFEFQYIGDRGEKTQSTTSAMDLKNEVILFSQIMKDGVACWNTKVPLKPENFHLLFSDAEKLSFPNEVMIDEENNFWVLSNRMPKALFDKLDLTDVNIRIFKAPVEKLLAQSPCK